MKKGILIAVIDLGHLADILHRDRLSAAGVVGDGDRAKGDILCAGLFDEVLQLANIHVALERVVVARVEGLIDDQVGGPAAAGADVAFGGVEVHVGGDGVAGFDQ